MKKLIILVLIGVGACLHAQKYIADYTVAKEEVLRSIPEEYIDKARNEFKIAYWHTSHGTHVYYGLCGLQDYKVGDDELFGITNNNPTTDKLEFHDIYGSDLSSNETYFIQTSKDYLSNNPDINVIMWSWCDIAGHNVSGNYLPGMQELINEYGVGGSMIGSGDGQREQPVYFIFMTGHANRNNNLGEGKPKSQADLIINYCNINELFCLDYYSIDTHDMSDNYWDDAGDDGNSTKYGGTQKFYQDYQDDNLVGDGYFENKNSPGGTILYGAHNTQHITSNRKAYAMWWILARFAGWSGVTTDANRLSKEKSKSLDFYYDENSRQIILTQKNEIHGLVCRVYNEKGNLCVQRKINKSTFILDGLSEGIYIVSIESSQHKKNMKIIVK